MTTKLNITLFVCVALLTGCATSTANYAPPVENRIINSKLIAKPFDIVWDSLVKELSGDFFVINNIDKNSRLINLSFSSQRPSEFVDCGTTSRTFKNAVADQKYTYKTSDAANFTITNPYGYVFNVRRSARLEGRTNIYVAPEGSGTNVTVNTRYVISIAMATTALDGRPSSAENFVFDPSTKQSFTDGSVTCIAVGAIEEKILRAAQ